jgi:ABC-type branched-subunit amino acid transport system ATPase component
MRRINNNTLLKAEPGPGLAKKNKEVVLRANKLSKSFGGQLVLDNINLELYEGEVVLLRGDNGSGKTTLINILTGNIEPDKGTIQIINNGISEYFHFPRKWWNAINPFDHFVPERVAAEGVGRTWQDIRLFSSQDLLDNISIATPDQMGENPFWAILKRSKAKKQDREIQAAANNILSDLGLKGRERSSADMISLGQSKRVAIARAIQAGARILFLDEPLSGLDGNGILEVMALLKNIARQKKITIVIVEHLFNIPKILDIATSVWTLIDKKITVEDPIDVKKRIKTDLVGKIHHLIGKIVKSEFEVTEQKLDGDAILSTVKPSGIQQGDAVLQIEDIVVHRGARLVIGKREPEQLVGLSFTVLKGQLAVLLAPNGWGKTTLLEAISGLIPLTRGTIKLNGEYIHNSYPWERSRKGLSFLQARDNTFPGLSVRDMLRFANVADVPGNIQPLIKKQVLNLSGGEKQKVAIACSFYGKASAVCMLDEPFSALDANELGNLYLLLRNLLKNSAILLVVPKSYV